MAPQKRSRNDQEEIVDVTGASSSLHQDTQRKKARISSLGPSKTQPISRDQHDAESSSDDDEEINYDEDDDLELPPSTQYEMIRDGNFDHLKHQAEDDRYATQKRAERLENIGDNVEASNAIIQEITCINFMCHERLHMEIGPLINFVVGHNGSGKSAVLTAITLCLGGKAAATGRGNSAKSLIKSGTDECRLKIRLKNEGEDAYQPDIFGKSIIIERHFSRTGNGCYKLKNDREKLISSRKGAIDDITEYYQLHVDNPMNILTQDDAKKFISKSTPSEKYNFFHKGVQLEQLDNDYKLVAETVQRTEALLHQNEDKVAALVREREEAKKRQEIFDEAKDIKNYFKVLRNQMAWAQVEEQEVSLREKEQAVSLAQANIEDRQRVIEQRQQEFQTCELVEQRAVAALEGLNDGRSPLNDEVEEAVHAHDTCKAAVAKMHAEQREIKGNLKIEMEKKEKIESDIKEEEHRIEAANGGSRARMLAELEEAQATITGIKTNMEQHVQTRPRLTQEHKAATDAHKSGLGPLKEKRSVLSNAERALEDSMRAGPGAMDGFDRKMPNLLNKLRQDRGFVEEPVGPFGKHIKLLESTWSEILETTLGNNLNAFAVTNKADQQRLRGHLKSCGMDFCPIYIGNRRPIDTSRNEPDARFSTILRALEIDEEIVRNQLIINNTIDQMLLIENSDEAYQIMSRGRPANVRKCFSINRNEHGWGVVLYYNSSGNALNQDFVRPKFIPPRMRTDNQSVIRMQKERVGQLQDEVRKMDNDQRSLFAEEQKAQRALDTFEKKLHDLKVRLQRAEQHQENLRAEYDNSELEEGLLEQLKTELVEVEGAVSMYEETYGNSSLEKVQVNEASSAAKATLEEARMRLAEQESKIHKTEMKIQNAADARGLALVVLNAAVEGLDLAKREKEKAEAKVLGKRDLVASFTEGAITVSPRVPVPANETAATLDEKLKSTQKKLEQVRRRAGGDEEQVSEIYQRAMEKALDAEAECRNMQQLVDTLKKSYMQRLDQYRAFQRWISARSRTNFQYLLGERKYRGKLLLDHKKKTLDVHVEPDATKKEDAGRQTKTLSGGEKSFSSVCLLLSLWEAMGSPLRCLDEFDVYMDDINRDVSTSMIISVARRAVGKQFILITPKALGKIPNIEAAPDIKRHKLRDPREKNQRSMEDFTEGA